MKHKLSILMVALASSVSCAQTPDSEIADTVYTNGRIYTVNAAEPWAEAVAFQDGKFLVVGSNADVEAVTGNGTEVVDLAGRFVMPGLVDTHTHPFISAFVVLDRLALENPQTPQDIQRQVADYAEAHPEKEWILGEAWPKGMFPGENPHRSLLDEVVPDRPVCLQDQGGHSHWCNTKALELAGVMNPSFEAPAYGVVERDEDGVPSGTIRDTMIVIISAAIVEVMPARWLRI